MLFQIDWEPENVTTTATKAVLTAGSNRPFRIRELCVGFDGVTAAQIPLEVQLVRASAAGTGTSRTLVKLDERDGNSIQATGLTVITGEPTYTIKVMRFFLHTQTPPLIWQPPERDFLIVTGGSIIGLKIVGTPAPDVKCLGYIRCEE